MTKNEETLEEALNNKDLVCLKTYGFAKQLARASVLMNELEWNDERAKKIKTRQYYLENSIYRFLQMIHEFEDEDFAKGDKQ